MIIALTGRLLRPEGPVDASILVENGRIVSVEEKIPERPDAGKRYHGLIIPGLVNMHTHTGDHGARGDLPPTLDKVVMPGGIKHRFLSSAGRGELISSIRSSLEEMRPGVTQVMDFREGGHSGIDMLEKALTEGLPHVYSMGRPAEGENGRSLMDRVHGYGAPSLSDLDRDLWEYARGRNKLLSVHASELYREDIDRVLDLSPDIVVHMVSGTEEDWKALAERKIPVVVCPRSNSAYGLPMVLPEMLASGLDLMLGTDNSMTMFQDMFREMEAAWLQLRRSGMNGAEASGKVFSMAVAGIEGRSFWDRLPSYTRWWQKGWPAEGDPAYLTVLKDTDRSGEDLFSRIVRFSTRSDVLFTGP